MPGTVTLVKGVLSLAGLLLVQMACGGGGKDAQGQQPSGGNNPPVSGRITLSGHFAAGSAVQAQAAPGASIAAAEAISAATVATVMVFNTNGQYSTAPVTNGGFSIPVDSGAPVAMIFAGAANDFLGYLTLGNGINSLPMMEVTDGTTSIDLQALSAAGQVVTPGHNPLGAELPLSAAEQAAFAQCNGLFASVASNPDMDGNGAIDLLEGHFYRAFVAYGVSPMSFSGALTPVIPSNLAIQYFNLSVMSNDGSDSGPVTVTGPAGSGLTDAACMVAAQNSQVYYSVYSNLGSSSTPVPVAGDYVFRTTAGKTLTVRVPDQSAANSRIVIAVPTMTLSSGNLSRIDWVYQNAGSNNPVSPAALVEMLIIQVDHPLGSRLYNSSGLPSSVTSHTLTNQGIPWDGSTHLCMAYNDVFGNHYVVSFGNP